MLYNIPPIHNKFDQEAILAVSAEIAGTR
jgi:hypothetical protein